MNSQSVSRPPRSKDSPDFRRLFELAPSCLLVLAPDEKFTIIAASDLFLLTTMTERDAIVGRPLFDVFPENPADKNSDGIRNVRFSIETAIQTRLPHTMDLQKYDIQRPSKQGGGFEERYWKPRDTPVLNSDGGVEYIIHSAEDVTEALRLSRENDVQQDELRLNAERIQKEISGRAFEVQELNRQLISKNAALAAGEEQFRDLADNMAQLAWMANADGSRFWFNQRWLDFTGTRPDEVKGWGWKKVHHPDHIERTEKGIRASIESGEPWEDTYPLRGRDGEYRWFLSHALPIRNSEGRIVRWFGTNTDITDQRRTAEELRLIQENLENTVKRRTAELDDANRTLRELTARLLHLQDEQGRRIARELHDSAGQYLAAIQMNLSALLRDLSASSGVNEPRISDAIELASLCTSEIRTVSYLLHPPLLDEMGLASAISWFIEGSLERSGIQVEVDIPRDLPRLDRDTETALFRVVQQGLGNIHRHSGSTTAKIRIESDAEFVMVEVSDRGRGILPDVLQGFKSGTRLAGIGIAGMRERITSMGGKFEIQASDQGTIVSVSLPVTPRSEDLS